MPLLRRRVAKYAMPSHLVRARITCILVAFCTVRSRSAFVPWPPVIRLVGRVSESVPWDEGASASGCRAAGHTGKVLITRCDTALPDSWDSLPTRQALTCDLRLGVTDLLRCAVKCLR